MNQLLDELGMIRKIANNETNREPMNLNRFDDIERKLNYYRSLLGKTHDLAEPDFLKLQENIRTFFNLKSVYSTRSLPQYLVRISNNNRILAAQRRELSYLTDISQLLAPPKEFCNYGRCNLPNQQVAYCGFDEASAYWETKPQKGDVITISRFELKEGAKGFCSVIKVEKTPNPKILHDLQRIYYTIDEFFIDVFSLEVDRNRPRDYLFSSLISSELLYNPVPARGNIEAIIYPSVQRKKMGDNFAIKNELLLEKYNLYSVETKFILDEFENLDPSVATPTTDCIIGSFGTTAFDLKKGEILYSEKADEMFRLFRMMQNGPEKQIRFDNGPDVPKNISFNLAPLNFKHTPRMPTNIVKEKTSLGRNDKIDVRYNSGEMFFGIKYKKVKADLAKGYCQIIK